MNRPNMGFARASEMLLRESGSDMAAVRAAWVLHQVHARDDMIIALCLRSRHLRGVEPAQEIVVRSKR